MTNADKHNALMVRLCGPEGEGEDAEWLWLCLFRLGWLDELFQR